MAKIDKLRQVNDFLNQSAVFVDDSDLWYKEDYWATPSEFIARGAGDCEDYAIAKYFTLLEMGVSESKLRITYANAQTIKQVHMVLTYYAAPDQPPLVLENLIATIKPATELSDLVPVYSFNGRNLWLAKSKSLKASEDGADRLSLWRDLQNRLFMPP